MSWWTHARDSVTSVAAPIASTVAFGLPSMMIGSGSSAIGGLMGMLGMGGSQSTGAGSFSGYNAVNPAADTSQNGSLMDMLAQQYGQSPYGQSPVNQTGSANLTNQGLI